MNSEPTPKAVGESIPEVVYCVDSSVLMTLGRSFPLHSKPFENLWNGMERLIRVRRLIAPEEVLHEIERGTDDLVSWAQLHHSMFVPPDPLTLGELRRLVTLYGPAFAGLGKGRVHADPWLVAVAIRATSLLQRAVVVCNERPAPGRIPYICQQEGIECIDHALWFEREGWGFA